VYNERCGPFGVVWRGVGSVGFHTLGTCPVAHVGP